MKTVRTLLAALAVAAAAVLLTAAPASAHAQLVSSDPKDGAVLDEAPATAVLEFSERIDAPSTQIAVTDGAGAVVPTRPFVVDGVKLTVPLSLPAPGPYTIGYRIVSEDGHRVDGKIAFTANKATEGASTAPSPSGNTPVASTPAAASGDERSEDGIPAIYWILGGIVVAVAVVVVVAVLARRKSTARP